MVIVASVLRTAALFLGASALFCATPAVAAEPTATEIAAAKRWFQEGAGFEKEGRWALALDRFRRAAEIKRTPQILFHVGICEEHVGALVEALVDLERAHDLGQSQGSADVVGAADAELTDLRPRIPTLRIVIPKNTVADRVLLDGAAVAMSVVGEPMSVNPGDHEVTLEAGRGSTRKTVALKERDAATVALDAPAPSAVLEPGATPPLAGKASGPPPTASPSAAGHSKSTLGWILVASGGAALGGSVLFWVLRGNEVSKLDRECPDHVCKESSRTAVTDDISTGKLYTTLGVALGAAGIAAIAGGAFLIVPRADARNGGIDFITHF
jgi:hypothetical protein